MDPYWNWTPLESVCNALQLFFVVVCLKQAYKCRYTTVAVGIHFLNMSSFPDNIYLLHSPLPCLPSLTDAKHLYMLSGYSTLTLMSPGMRVKWTIKGIGYLQQRDHRHARTHTNVHQARPALQQRVKDPPSPVYSLTEGARYCHEESWPREGAGDGMWKITVKTSLSVKSYNFWQCSLDQR